MSTFGVAVGETVRLELTWGTVRRNQCAVCVRYVGDGPNLTCASCGTSYLRITQGVYEVTGVGRG